MLNKHQLWLIDNERLLCIDHVVLSDCETGRRLTPADYAGYLDEGVTPACVECEGSNDQARFGNVYLLFGTHSTAGLARSRANHPSSRKITQRVSETEKA